MKMTSSVSPARTAASSSSGTVHHAASSGEATTATLSPSSRETAYRPRPGMPMTAASRMPRPRSPPKRREIEPDASQGVLAGLPHQVHDQGDQSQREHDAQELVQHVPEDLGIPIRVQLRLLLTDRRGPQRCAHEREHGIQSRLPNRDGQDDADLPPQAGAGGPVSGKPHIRWARRGGHLVRLPHSRPIELRLCNVFASCFEHPTPRAYRFPIRAPSDPRLTCAHNPAQEEQ